MSPEQAEIFKVMFDQMDILREKLDLINVTQVHLKGYEADDIIFTYTQNLTENEEAVVVTIG